MTTLFYPPFAPGTRPRIAYTNLFDSAAATLSTDSEEDGFEHEHIADGLPFTYWQAEDGSPHYVKAAFGVAQDANFFCFYNHDLHENGGTIALQYSTDSGSTWTTAADAAPADNKPVYLSFDTIGAAQWRIYVTADAGCKIGVVAFGMDLELERGVWIGFQPPSMNFDVELTTNVSESGTFLGRSLMKRGAKIALALDHLTHEWVYAYWRPFMLAALTAPFFVKWDEADHPDEVIYAWLNQASDLDAPAISKHRTMKAGFRALGRVD